MTRKQIETKAKELMWCVLKEHSWDEKKQIEECAIMMADWLLSRQWVSVEDYSKDELPPLSDNNDPYGESVQVLFIVELDGIQYVNKGSFDYATGVWHSLDMQCSYLKENVTHWMPIPPLAEKGGER